MPEYGEFIHNIKFYNLIFLHILTQLQDFNVGLCTFITAPWCNLAQLRLTKPYIFASFK